MALIEEAAAQSSSGKCYPTTTNMVGQQMDSDSLERAYRYGLRLLVVLAVNSEFMCLAGRFPTPVLQFGNSQVPQGCFDREYIDAQLLAAKAFEARIDEEAGGPGLGWYRIVYTPAEARQVIGDGKLAVVLGVESANAFGCWLIPYSTFPGVGGVLGGSETAYRSRCQESAVDGISTPWAMAMMEHYWNLGARHFFPIHTLNGIAGGAALFNPMLHARDNPSRQTDGILIGEIDRVIREARPPHQTSSCSIFDFDGGACNAEGLTETGRALVRNLADYGAIIDVDHMSLRAERDLVREIGEYYPVVSSHTGAHAIQHGDKSNEAQNLEEQIARIVTWGGAIAPILTPANQVKELDTWPAGAVVAPHKCGGTSESFIQVYRYLVDQLSHSRTAATTVTGDRPALIGLGFGSDFNGFAGWPQPRFSRDPLVFTGAGGTVSEWVSMLIGSPQGKAYGRCYVHENTSEPRVSYQFVSPLTGESFDRMQLPWSGRTAAFDVSYDGVVNVGMIPDFVEELRVLLGYDLPDDLEPIALWNGAEAYIRMWENAISWSGRLNPERDRGILTDCRRLRSELIGEGTWVPNSSPATIIDATRWRNVLEQMKQVGCVASE
jgi:microsomal dipeptidase-like Zn-dependent dipeptidase